MNYLPNHLADGLSAHGAWQLGRGGQLEACHGFADGERIRARPPLPQLSTPSYIGIGLSEDGMADQADYLIAQSGIHELPGVLPQFDPMARGGWLSARLEEALDDRLGIGLDDLCEE